MRHECERGEVLVVRPRGRWTGDLDNSWAEENSSPLPHVRVGTFLCPMRIIGAICARGTVLYTKWSSQGLQLFPPPNTHILLWYSTIVCASRGGGTSAMEKVGRDQRRMEMSNTCTLLWCWKTAPHLERVHCIISRTDNDVSQ